MSFEEENQDAKAPYDPKLGQRVSTYSEKRRLDILAEKGDLAAQEALVELYDVD